MVEINQMYSIVPVPPDGKVILTISAGSNPLQNDSLYPIVPGLVILQHVVVPTVVKQVTEHPLTSVTVTVYVPAARLEIVAVLAALLHK